MAQTEVAMRLALWGFQQEVIGVSSLPAGSLECEKRILRVRKNHGRQLTIQMIDSFWLRPLGRAGSSVLLSCNSLFFMRVFIFRHC